MANEFLLAYLESQHPVMRGRLIMAVLKAAITISKEAANSPNSAQRRSLASAVARDPLSYAETFSLLILAHNPDLSNRSPDAVLFENVMAVWNTLAGV